MKLGWKSKQNNKNEFCVVYLKLETSTHKIIKLIYKTRSAVIQSVHKPIKKLIVWDYFS